MKHVIGGMLIFRSLEEIFETVVGKKGIFQFTISVSYLEIYKEELRDLLWGVGVAGEGSRELHIRETEGGNTGKVGSET